MNSIFARKKFPISNKSVVICDRIVCLCVEYLDFSQEKDYEKYRHCMITNTNNKKYEKKLKEQETKDRFKRAQEEKDAVNRIFEMMRIAEEQLKTG
tara:strand:- start:408 stop:695 length:288 start_codon:yes stop_codon:yes gene_type:complete